MFRRKPAIGYSPNAFDNPRGVETILEGPVIGYTPNTGCCVKISDFNQGIISDIMTIVNFNLKNKYGVDVNDKETKQYLDLTVSTALDLFNYSYEIIHPSCNERARKAYVNKVAQFVINKTMQNLRAFDAGRNHYIRMNSMGRVSSRPLNGSFRATIPTYINHRCPSLERYCSV